MNASVIIPVWNGIADLPTCLNALLAQKDVAFEIIAVDNASDDESASYIADNFPSVTLIRNETNAGFSAACNIGLRHATGDVLVLLNQDTEVKEGWLAVLLRAIEQDNRIGIAGSKALFKDGTIQHAGGQVDAQGYGSHIGYMDADDDAFNQRRDVDYVTGASLAISRQAYVECGGFDENFGLTYYEDVDLCYRVRDAQYRVVYEPGSLLIHNERSISADGSIESHARIQRNRLRFVFKNWSSHKLRDEFVPQEERWLSLLGPEDPVLVNAIRRAYLRLLMTSAELSSYRQRRFNDGLDILPLIQSLWLRLEQSDPLRFVGYDQTTYDIPASMSFAPIQRTSSLLATIESIRQKHPVRPQPFRSSVPIIGPLIAGFRRQWNRVAAEWFVRPLLAQQNAINTELIETVDQFVHLQKQVIDAQRHAFHLQSAYAAELAHQISKLEETIRLQGEDIGTQNDGYR